jgi:hypothetical protein
MIAKVLIMVKIEHLFAEYNSLRLALFVWETIRPRKKDHNTSHSDVRPDKSQKIVV